MSSASLLALSSLLLVTGCATRASQADPTARKQAIAEAVPLASLAFAPAEEDNLDAGRFHRIDGLRAEWRRILGRDLEGNGVLVGVYEAEGAPVASHEAFGTRLRQKDGSASFGHHATHVAGTVGANPPSNQSAAQGMAPTVSMHAYDIRSNHIADLRQAESRMAASVHSYNWPAGWPRGPDSALVCASARGAPPSNASRPCWVWLGEPGAQEDSAFGQYGEFSETFDEIALSMPTRSFVVSAGNERDDAPGGPSWDGWYVSDDSWTFGAPPRDGGVAGYDTIPGDHSASKNVITVGSLDDRPTLAPQNIQVSAFSSFGPTDDGRIKPDLVANGNILYSATYARLANGNPNLKAYRTDFGTSMAAPVVAGIIALLSELSVARRGSALFSDEAKAVLIHTAVNAVPGPSYSTGWGAVDAAAAGQIVGGADGAPRLLRARTVAPHYELRLRGAAGVGVKITLVWLDRPGKPVSGLDAPDRQLLDDLDLLVIDPDGTRYAPWALNPAEGRRGDAPTRCVQPASQTESCPTNDRDNVEQVQVDPAKVKAGDWVIRVVAPAQSLNRPFALVLSGLAITAAP